MINAQNVLLALSKLTLDEAPRQPASSVSAEEHSIASNLYDCLNSILESSSRRFETETTLDHEEDVDEER